VSTARVAGKAGTNGHDPKARFSKTKKRDENGGGSLPGQIARGLASQVTSRIPVADLDERDPDYIRERLPGLWLLASLYWRGEVRGLGNVPEEGAVLMVGNHSGGNLTPDTGVFTLAFSSYFGVERAFYQLVYPGGDYEVHRPFWERNKVDFNRRKGFIRLALEHDVPIVPVVSVGGQETALFLSRGETLAKLLRLDKMFRLKVLPISIAPPWGLNVGDMMGHIPLPAKITVEALSPIDIRAEFGEEPDLDDVYDHVIRVMQETLDALASERRLPVIG